MIQNDAARVRLFIAVELPEDITRELGNLQERLKKACGGCPAKWVAPASIHLTLNFLGDVSADRIDGIKNAVSNACAMFEPFELSLAAPGAFPNLERPHVVWVGLGGEVETLARLQRLLEQNLAKLGFTPENRPFSPHLTLARVRDEAAAPDKKRLGEAIIRTRCEASCSMRAVSVSLIRSHLTPSGPVYTVLYKANLAML